MKVTLNISNQFGDDGPQAGDSGLAQCLRWIDDEYWCLVHFDMGLVGWCALTQLTHWDSDVGVMTTEV